jgi:hypothetical protein
MKLILKITLLIAFVSICYAAKAQEQNVTIKGSQKIIDGNLTYSGETNYVIQNAKIVSISGDKVSFVLKVGDKDAYQFIYNEGKYYPSLDSVVIEPNVYNLYPFLPDDKDSVNLILTLKYLTE